MFILKRFRLVNNSITTKFNVLFVVLILVFLVFFTYNQIIMRRYQDSYERDVSMYYDLISMKSNIAEADDSIQAFLQSGNRAFLSEHNDAVRSFDLALRALQNREQTAETASFLRSIDDSFYSYQKVCNYSAQYYSQGNSYQSSVMSVEAERIGSYLRHYCDDLLQQSIVSNRQSFEEIHSLQQLWLTASVWVLVALVVLFIGSVAYFHFNLTIPLNELHEAALAIGQGKKEVAVRENFTEHTARVLSRAFNAMSENIAKMMQDIKDKAEIENRLLNEELKNAKYENLLEQANFLALQSQTNPHFLFNTLNGISRTITLGKSDEAVLMIDAMAKLLRYNLSDSSRPVSLREELDVVREYLKIQQYRFKERVNGSIDCDEELADAVLLPRFTLQPLVENAIIHGLEPKPNGGHIHVEAKMEDSLCVVTVRDDGMGMSSQRCMEIMGKSNRHKEGQYHSIGVQNTKRRLERFTQLPKCMEIRSIVGEGTVFRVYLPLAENQRNGG